MFKLGYRLINIINSQSLYNLNRHQINTHQSIYRQSDDKEWTKRELMNVPARWSHSQYIEHLKDHSWVMYQDERLKYLYESTSSKKIKDYLRLKQVINEMIGLCKHVVYARSYHPSFTPQLTSILSYLEGLILQTFSQELNNTY